MRLRTEREHGLHICTNNKLYIQQFYTSQREPSPVKGQSPDLGTIQLRTRAEIELSTA